MSLLAMSWALKSNTPPTQKLILVVLADHANTEGECFPSIASLAAAVGIGRRSIARHLASMEQRGLIKRVTRTRPDGSQTSNTYRLLGVSSVSGGEGHERPPNESSNNGTSVTEVTELPPPSAVEVIGWGVFVDVYPARNGGQKWPEARKRWMKLSTKDRDLVLKAAGNYKNYLEGMGKVGTEYVAMASTFFGGDPKTKGEFWREWVEYEAKDTNTTTGSGYIRMPLTGELP
jgi:hypothetical protein